MLEKNQTVPLPESLHGVACGGQAHRSKSREHAAGEASSSERGVPDCCVTRLSVGSLRYAYDIL
jgi:hypothetical protein